MKIYFTEFEGPDGNIYIKHSLTEDELNECGKTMVEGCCPYFTYVVDTRILREIKILKYINETYYEHDDGGKEYGVTGPMIDSYMNGYNCFSECMSLLHKRLITDFGADLGVIWITEKGKEFLKNYE